MISKKGWGDSPLILFISRGQNGITDDIAVPAVSYSFHTIRYRVSRNDPVVKLDVNSVVTMA